MARTNYISRTIGPERIVICRALNGGNYSKKYSGRVSEILKDIPDEDLRAKVKETLEEFKTENDGKLALPSPYKLVVLQEILPKEKVLVTRPGLETAKKSDYHFMSGFHIDCGLNLVPYGEYKVNPVHAKKLTEDLKHVGVDLTSSKLIPYNILTHQISGESSSGLVFKLSEKGKDTAKKLILNTGDFRWDYARPENSGLFRVCLLDRDWAADGEDLAYPHYSGRVVVETTFLKSSLLKNSFFAIYSFFFRSSLS